MFKNPNESIQPETVEYALERGVKIKREECVLPNSIVFPDQYGMQRRKRRTKYKYESESKSKKVDVEALLAKCTQAQRAKLLPILRKQGIDV